MLCIDVGESESNEGRKFGAVNKMGRRNLSHKPLATVSISVYKQAGTASFTVALISTY